MTWFKPPFLFKRTTAYFYLSEKGQRIRRIQVTCIRSLIRTITIITIDMDKRKLTQTTSGSSSSLSSSSVTTSTSDAATASASSIEIPKDTKGNIVLSRPVRRMLQNFLLIWLDANLDESNEEFMKSRQQLRRFVASITVFTDVQE
jgi:hypothetical protein